jgi:hypothetical protein
VHHLLQIVGSELYEWVGLTSQQAYWKQSRLLLSSESLRLRRPALESISEDLQAPVKRMRAALRNGGGGEGVTLRQQLDSVIPFLPAEERIQATLEMINTWSEAAPLPLPYAVQFMYA